MSVHAPSSRTLLLGGAVAVGATAASAASAARRRLRHDDLPPQPAPSYEPVVAGTPIAMSPEQLDAALCAAFPGDETPGYL